MYCVRPPRLRKHTHLTTTPECSLPRKGLGQRPLRGVFSHKALRVECDEVAEDI
jgi:hypothetical protein